MRAAVAIVLSGILVGIFGLVYLSGSDHPLLPRLAVFVIQTYRLRYSLLGAIAPILVVWACVGPLRGYLFCGLVLRNAPKPLLRLNQYFLDLFNVSWLTATIAVTSASTGIVTLMYADQRFGPPTQYFESPNKTAAIATQPTDTVSSPIITSDEASVRFSAYAIWAIPITSVLSLALPLAATWLSIRQGIPSQLFPKRSTRLENLASLDRMPTQHSVIAWLASALAIGLGYGLVLVTFAIASRQNAINFDWLAEMMCDLPIGGGYIYIDSESVARFNSPHTTLMMIGGILTVLYIAWYALGTVQHIMEKTWAYRMWPILFYIMLLFLMLILTTPGIAFFVDLFGVPPSLVIFFLLVAIAWIARTDHYFELLQPVEKAASRVSTDVLPHSEQESHPNAFVAACDLHSCRPRNPDDDFELPIRLPYWTEYLQTLSDTGRVFSGPKAKPLVIVTASGGGIQAAAWATRVLYELDTRYSDLVNSICLFSPVSGGSTGIMHFLAHRAFRNTPLAYNEEQADKEKSNEEEEINASRWAYRAACRSSLEAVAWGILFPDFVRTVAPLPWFNKMQDRGWALEASWWNNLTVDDAKDWSKVQSLQMSQLSELTRIGKLPPVIFNATSVETGQRVMLGTIYGDRIRPNSDPHDSSGASYVDRPIDYFRLLAELATKASFLETDMRVTTAVRLSATFSYVTPVARPFSASFEQAATKAKTTSPDDISQTRRKMSMHICDGGYADNSGVVTAVQLVRQLLFDRTSNLPAPEIDQVILLRIEPFPPSEQRLSEQSAGVFSSLFGPASALANARTSSQAERGRLETQLLELAASGRFRELLFQFRVPSVPSKRDPLPPLTWRLTPDNLRDLDQAWEQIANPCSRHNSESPAHETPLQVLDGIFQLRSARGR